MNAKIQKSFALKDWFGEQMGNRSRIDFYVDISNVFNRRGAIEPYVTTGDPLDDYHMNLRPVGMFNHIPWYKEASAANPASYSVDQYDWYGNRLYNEACDFDKNGIVTQQEKYQAYKNYYENTSIQYRNNYQIPIRVSAGFAISF